MALNESWNPLAQRAESAEAELRKGRERICLECKREADWTIGIVHSESACMRCGKSPQGLGWIVRPKTSTEVAEGRAAVKALTPPKRKSCAR